MNQGIEGVTDEFKKRNVLFKRQVSMLYEWLRDYQKLEQDIDYLQFKLEQNEIELKRWVEGDLMNVPLQRESIAANLEDDIKKIKEEIQRKTDQVNKLVELVEKFKGIEHKILKLKYVDGMTLELIAEELNYSASYIYKKHAEIIKRIKFVDSFHFINTQ